MELLNIALQKYAAAPSEKVSSLKTLFYRVLNGESLDIDENMVVVSDPIEDCDDNGKDCASFSFKLKKDAIRFAKAFGLPLEGPYDYDFSNPWLPYDWNGDWDDLPGFRD